MASTPVLPHPSWFARRGFVVVVQDCRGRGDSGGTFTPFVDEARDGAASIEWAATLPVQRRPGGDVRVLVPGLGAALRRGATPAVAARRRRDDVLSRALRRLDVRGRLPAAARSSPSGARSSPGRSRAAVRSAYDVGVAARRPRRSATTPPPWFSEWLEHPDDDELLGRAPTRPVRDRRPGLHRPRLLRRLLVRHGADSSRHSTPRRSVDRGPTCRGAPATAARSSVTRRVRRSSPNGSSPSSTGSSSVSRTAHRGRPPGDATSASEPAGGRRRHVATAAIGGAVDGDERWQRQLPPRRRPARPRRRRCRSRRTCWWSNPSCRTRADAVDFQDEAAVGGSAGRALLHERRRSPTRSIWPAVQSTTIVTTCDRPVHDLVGNARPGRRRTARHARSTVRSTSLPDGPDECVDRARRSRCARSPGGAPPAPAAARHLGCPFPRLRSEPARRTCAPAHARAEDTVVATITVHRVRLDLPIDLGLSGSM